MRQRVDGKVGDIVRQHMIAPGEISARLGGRGERERPARRGGMFDFCARLRRNVLASRRRDETNDIVLHRRRQVNALCRGARLGDLPGAQRRGEAGSFMRSLALDEIENFPFGRGVRADRVRHAA